MPRRKIKPQWETSASEASKRVGDVVLAVRNGPADVSSSSDKRFQWRVNATLHRSFAYRLTAARIEVMPYWSIGMSERFREQGVAKKAAHRFAQTLASFWPRPWLKCPGWYQKSNGDDNVLLLIIEPLGSAAIGSIRTKVYIRSGADGRAVAFGDGELSMETSMEAIDMLCKVLKKRLRRLRQSD